MTKETEQEKEFTTSLEQLKLAEKDA